MYQRILIPTDGSTYSEAAIPQGLQLAQKLGVPVTFFHVLDDSLSPIVTASTVPSRKNSSMSLKRA